MSIVFCHGLESGPHGSKFQAMSAAGLSVVAPDCRGLALAARVATISEVIAAEATPPVVVGSSYGGLAAVCVAELLAARGVRVRALLLCAPALAHPESPASELTLAPAAPTVVIHGLRDEIISIDVSRRWVAAHPGVKLIEVDDDHRLSSSLEVIVAAARALGTEVGATA